MMMLPVSVPMLILVTMMAGMKTEVTAKVKTGLRRLAREKSLQ
jgi:hypothetical protein